MFRTRLFSGVILILLALITVISGGNILFFTTIFISTTGLIELYKVVKAEKSILGAAGYLAAFVYFALLYFQKEEFYLHLTIGFLMLLMAVYVFSFPKFTFEQVSGIFFGLFYVVVMLSYLYKIRIAEDGAYLVWLIFLASWGCDTCAYCVGMLIGKHKLAPVLSPKKSIEGAVGGVVGAVLLGFLYGYIFRGQFQVFHNPVTACGIICGAGSVLSQIGDLAASAIKRNHEIKDYGRLIPGHGGILDRFDSVIFTAPVIYIVSMLLGTV